MCQRFDSAPRHAEVAEKVDASVSKTGGGRPPCRFESGLRHDAELCSGSTGDFGSPSPGSNPGSAAKFVQYKIK